MNYSNYEDIVVLGPVNDPIAVYKVFANLIIIKLRNDAAGIREHLEIPRGVEDLIDYGPCVGRRVAIDVFGDGINVVECRR